MRFPSALLEQTGLYSAVGNLCVNLGNTLTLFTGADFQAVADRQILCRLALKPAV